MLHPDSDKIAAYLLGELNEDEQAAITAHFQICASCSALLESERSLRSLLRLDEVQFARPDSRRIVEMIDELTPDGRRAANRRLWLRRWARVAMIAAIGLIVYLCRPVDDQEEQRLAAEIGISTELQREIVSNLDSIRVLRGEPWLADEEYETAKLLSELMQQRGGGAQ
ncbi:MAG: zf-HC2 domain-containing protein [Phycisphaerales bacterium]|nr:zf-HC2 domain-containing protein [Phycisphaerales bacterium]